ncbi:Plug domain-containing protein [Komagataeibacter nataicola]|uniref:Plug domain-containing protein n=1 Tax=Komagataeibacter nataicola TaxID=265960 RepID=UPI0028A7EDC3|nr:Plug domain-containing protein [Komagataeibacter nataicola]WNM08610.1 Plug domain-containing protein [Komagataeibacter nataicola]
MMAQQASPEILHVHSTLQTATGVTGTTPGGGLMPPQTAAKSLSGLTRDFIAKQSPTSNPTTMIASLPGVVTGSGDPLGTSDQQVSLSVRGLTQFELGYTYEGIPAADPLNFSFLPARRLITKISRTWVWHRDQPIFPLPCTMRSVVS